VLSPPFEMRGLLATRGVVLSKMVQVFVDEVFRKTAAWAKSQGLSNPQCGAVTFIQRFSKTLILHPHLHVIGLDGVFTQDGDDEAVVFHPGPEPTERDLLEVAKKVFERMGRFLDKEGLLSGDEDPTPLDRWFLRGLGEPSMLAGTGRVDIKQSAAEYGGFSVHAGVTVPKGDKVARERLCRYAARPPLAEDQLRRLEDGRIELSLRRRANNGQRVIALEPMRLLRRLCWLVPPPRQHQVRYHGILAPAARLRRDVVPKPPPEIQLAFPIQNMFPRKTEYRVPWATLLKKVYDVDCQRCPTCGTKMRPIGAVALPDDAQRVLRFMGPSARDSPQLSLALSA
jgi:hypothetical protein